MEKIEWKDSTRYDNFENAVWLAQQWCEWFSKSKKHQWIQDDEGDYWLDGTPPVAFVGIDKENKCVYATLPGFQGEKVRIFKVR